MVEKTAAANPDTRLSKSAPRDVNRSGDTTDGKAPGATRGGTSQASGATFPTRCAAPRHPLFPVGLVLRDVSSSRATFRQPPPSFRRAAPGTPKGARDRQRRPGRPNCQCWCRGRTGAWAPRGAAAGALASPEPPPPHPVRKGVGVRFS